MCFFGTWTEARCDALRLDDRQDGLLAWAKGGEVAGGCDMSSAGFSQLIIKGI